MICHPARRDIPNGLLVSLLTGFFNAYPKRRLINLLGTITQVHPWLGWYFPVLRPTPMQFSTPVLSPIPPNAPAVINHVLESVLQTLVRELPHLAIVHHLHEADAESLISLRAIQELPQQGLRVLASIDPAHETLHPAWEDFCRHAPEPMALPPLTTMKLRTYLAEVAPEIVRPELIKRLYEVSHGQPLAVETTLRAWVLDGWLTLGEDGWCAALPECGEEEDAVDGVPAPIPTPVTPQDDMLNRLAQAALVGSTTRSFLTMLWRLSPEETAALVEYGCLLGYLAIPAGIDTERVDFSDQDHQDSLLGRLTFEQQASMQQAIAALREEISLLQQRTVAPALADGPDAGEPGSPGATESEIVQDDFRAALRGIVTAELPQEIPHFHWNTPPPKR